MKEKIIPILLTTCIMSSLLPAHAEEVIHDEQNNAIINTEVFTEENVIYSALQDMNAGVSLFSDAPENITADFDVVLGFDMSSDMYGFDYNGEMTWIDSFTALEEQMPEGTRFSIVEDCPGEFEDNLTLVREKLSNTYESGSNINDLIQNCLNTFDSNSYEKNKIIIAVTPKISEVADIKMGINMAFDEGVIPFIFVLNTDESDELNEVENVSCCRNELELRLALSDLYLSFSEFMNAVPLSTVSTKDNSIYTSDLRPNNVFNDAQNVGQALISILNAYKCIPVRATMGNGENNKSYNLLNITNDSKAITTGTLIDILKGKGNALNECSNLGDFTFVWESVYDKRKVEEKERIKNIIESNLKKKFPVAVKYSDDKAGIVTQLSGDNVTVNFETQVSIDNIESAFDTWNYLNNIAVSSYNVVTNTVQSGVNFAMEKIYNDDFVSTGNVGVKKDTGVEVNETCYDNVFELTADLSTNTGKQIVVAAANHIDDNGIPKFYDSMQFYTLRLYRDVVSSEWYWDYLLKATNLKATEGDENNKFNPNKLLTRCEFVKMLLVAAQVDMNITTKRWNVKHWATDFMNKANELGILYEPKDGTDEQIANYFDEEIPRYEAAYTLKTLFMDQSQAVQIPTLIYQYNEDMKLAKAEAWKTISQSYPSNIEKSKEAVFQLYMNDVLVGDESGDLNLNGTIRRNEATKIVIKPLFELDDNTPQIIANIEDGDDTDTVVNIQVSSDKTDVPNIIFDSNNEREYTITIPDDSRYYVGTYGNLASGDSVTLNISGANNQICNKYNSKLNGHDAYYIQGGGTYNVKINRGLNSTVGLMIHKINAAQEIKFNQQTLDENENPHYYMFVDSPEHIQKSDVINDSNSTNTISLFEDLGPGTYTIFTYHHKSVNRGSSDDFAADDALYYNAVFYNNDANSLSNIKINNVGLSYFGDGNSWELQRTWQRFNEYRQSSDEPISQNNNLWLTDIQNIDSILISNNDNMGYVWLMMEFEVLSGKVDFATVAMANNSDFKSVVNTNLLKSTFKDLPAQVIKGKGEFSQEVESDIMEYYIDDTFVDGDTLKFDVDTITSEQNKISDRFFINASPLYYGCKNGFPQSASLGLTYDAYYLDIDGNEQYKTFYFDTYHSPYIKQYNVPDVVKEGPYTNKSVWGTNEKFDDEWILELDNINYNPYENSEDQASRAAFEEFLGTTNMQGYGVTFVYKFKIHNLGAEKKQLSHYVVLNRGYYIDCYVNGSKYDYQELYETEGIDKRYEGEALTKPIDLPAGSTTEIEIRVTEFAGANATVENWFEINNVDA